MKNHLTINLLIDWRALLFLGIMLVVFGLLYSGTSAEGSAASLPQSKTTTSLNAVRAVPGGLVAVSSGSGARRFYLTSATRYGNQALSTCTAGFHMASLWEILDVSNLRYAGDLPVADIRDDSGSGPPSGMVGWVRTGYSSSGSSSVGTGNCENWSTASSVSHGTAARLTNNWETPPDPVGLWSLEEFSCDINVRVWCVED
ncbi:MAG: hypothetical protein JXM73_09115 [Anaerolineae bacterium]|nr:hypothetical protein [Anaerolineae bacterium]